MYSLTLDLISDRKLGLIFKLAKENFLPLLTNEETIIELAYNQSHRSIAKMEAV